MIELAVVFFKSIVLILYPLGMSKIFMGNRRSAKRKITGKFML